MTPDETRALLERLEELDLRMPQQWVVQNTTVWSAISTRMGDRYVDDPVCGGGTNQLRYLIFIAETRNALPELLRLARLGAAVEEHQENLTASRLIRCAELRALRENQRASDAGGVSHA